MDHPSDVRPRNEPSQVQLFQKIEQILFFLLVFSVWNFILALHVEMDPYVMAKASTDQKKAEHVCSGKNLTLTPKSESAT